MKLILIQKFYSSNIEELFKAVINKNKLNNNIKQIYYKII